MKFKERIRYIFYKYILGHKYFTTTDVGSPDGDCYVLCRKDRKGIIHIEEIKSSK
jgi:hypothetical protein